MSHILLTSRERERVITRGKQILAKTHMQAAHLMDTYGEQYIQIEYDEELEMTLRIRMPFDGNSDSDSAKWDYRLEGRTAYVDDARCEVSSIKWHITVERD